MPMRSSLNWTIAPANCSIAGTGHSHRKIRDKTDMNETMRVTQAHPAEVMMQIIGNALLPKVRKAN